MWIPFSIQIPKSRMNLPLTILYYASSISGKVRFQKLVYLCTKEAGVTAEYEFRLHKFGPFCDELSEDLQELVVDKKLVTAEEISWMSPEGPSVLTVYSLTGSGKSTIEKKVLPAFDVATKNRVQEVVQRYNSLPLDKLLSYVYSNYV